MEVGNEIVMHFLLSLLDFKPLFVLIEANSGRVYFNDQGTVYMSRASLANWAELCYENLSSTQKDHLN